MPPKVSLKNIDVIVDYVQIGSITPVGERTFNFTVMNGEAVAFDSENLVVDAGINRDGDLKKVMGCLKYKAADTAGILPLYRIIFNVILNVLDYVKDFLRVGK